MKKISKLALAVLSGILAIQPIHDFFTNQSRNYRASVVSSVPVETNSGPLEELMTYYGDSYSEKSQEISVPYSQTVKTDSPVVENVTEKLNVRDAGNEAPDYVSDSDCVLEEGNNDNFRYRTEDYVSDSDCVLLARMIFGECDGCSEDEKVSVAYTAINRMKDGLDWNGDTLREVILKPYQYSSFNGGLDYRVKDPMKHNSHGFLDALRIAREVLDYEHKDPTDGATHFINHEHPSFRDGGLPEWTRNFHEIGKINNSRHVFYRPLNLSRDRKS